jgi:Ca2+-binding EF-hand superfamily protein
MKRLTFLASSLAVFALAGNLYAQDPADGAGKPADETAKPEEPKPSTAKSDKAGKGDRKAFGELGRVLRTKDTDRDNKLSKEELGDDELFTTLDKNEDGFLTLQEMAADKDAVIASVEKQAAEGVKEEFGILDRDSSTKLNKEELGDEFGGLLEKGDTDKDGELTLEEFTAARKTTTTAKEGKPAKGADILKKMDKDEDGKISKEEAGDKLKEQFDTLDTDGDGFLSADEIKAGRKMGKREKKAETPEGEKKEELPEGEKPAGEGEKSEG